MGGDYIDYIDPGYVLSFQGPSTTAEFHNGISFSPIEAEDLDDEDPLSARDYEFAFFMWSPDKMIAPHTETSIETDPSRGNRVVSTPLMIERVSASNTCILEVAHSKTVPVEFQSYNSGELIIRFTEIQSDISGWLEQGVTVARDIASTSSITGFDGLTINYISQVDEWDCEVVSFDGHTMVLNVTNPPVDVNELSDVRYIAPNNQTIFLIPLGGVIANISEYDDTSSSVGKTSWTYYEADSNTTAKYKVITPRIELSFDNLNDRHKFIIITERDKTFTDFGNGFQLITTAVV